MIRKMNFVLDINFIIGYIQYEKTVTKRFFYFYIILQKEILKIMNFQNQNLTYGAKNEKG